MLSKESTAALSVLRYCSRDGVVEAEIERPKIVRGDRRILLDGQLGNGLTDVSVVVNDLRDTEPHAKEVAPMLSGVLRADLRSQL